VARCERGQWYPPKRRGPVEILDLLPARAAHCGEPDRGQCQESRRAFHHRRDVDQLGRGEQRADLVDLEQRGVMLRRRWRGERAAYDRRRILVDQVLRHRVGKYGRDPLTDAAGGDQAAALLDDAQRVQNHRHGDGADRHRADRREHVALEAAKHVAGMHFRPTRPHVGVPLARDMLESTSLTDLRNIAGPRILAAAELFARLVAPGPGGIERHLGHRADRQQLLLPAEAELHSERLPAGRSDVKVQAALVEQLVGGRARPRGFHRSVSQHSKGSNSAGGLMKRTVFIVGAGASAEFGLPLGSALVDTIRDMAAAEVETAEQRPLIGSAIRAGLTGDFDEAVRDIAGGMNVARSIDRFLHSRRDRPLVTAIGKSAIAGAIAQAEARTVLGSSDLRDWHAAQAAMSGLRGTWLSRLFALLQEGHSPEESSTILDDVSFITFNYDRVIEQYLLLAFQHSMAQSEASARRWVQEKLPIHIYGSLGTLFPSSESSMPFGLREDMIPTIVEKMAAGIRTFTESQDSNLLTQAHNLISQAECVVFLGFAFDPLNVAALFPMPLRSDQRFAGTQTGVGPAELDNLGVMIGGAGAENRMRDISCANYIASFDFRDAVGL
jgi:hypothetical protein